MSTHTVSGICFARSKSKDRATAVDAHKSQPGTRICGDRLPDGTPGASAMVTRLVVRGCLDKRGQLPSPSIPGSCNANSRYSLVLRPFMGEARTAHKVHDALRDPLNRQKIHGCTPYRRLDADRSTPHRGPQSKIQFLIPLSCRIYLYPPFPCGNLSASRVKQLKGAAGREARNS